MSYHSGTTLKLHNGPWLCSWLLKVLLLCVCSTDTGESAAAVQLALIAKWPCLLHCVLVSLKCLCLFISYKATPVVGGCGGVVVVLCSLLLHFLNLLGGKQQAEFKGEVTLLHVFICLLASNCHWRRRYVFRLYICVWIALREFHKNWLNSQPKWC